MTPRLTKEEIRAAHAAHLAAHPEDRPRLTTIPSPHAFVAPCAGCAGTGSGDGREACAGCGHYACATHTLAHGVCPECTAKMEEAG